MSVVYANLNREFIFVEKGADGMTDGQTDEARLLEAAKKILAMYGPPSDYGHEAFLAWLELESAISACVLVRRSVEGTSQPTLKTLDLPRNGPETEDEHIVGFLTAFYGYPDRATCLRQRAEAIFDDVELIRAYRTLKPPAVSHPPAVEGTEAGASALTALIAQAERDTQAHLDEAAKARLHGNDNTERTHRTLAQVHHWFVVEMKKVAAVLPLVIAPAKEPQA